MSGCGGHPTSPFGTPVRIVSSFADASVANPLHRGMKVVMERYSLSVRNTRLCSLTASASAPSLGDERVNGFSQETSLPASTAVDRHRHVPVIRRGEIITASIDLSASTSRKSRTALQPVVAVGLGPLALWPCPAATNRHRTR